MTKIARAWMSSSAEFPRLSMAEFLHNLQRLAIGGVQWRDLTDPARAAMHSGFLRVTTLELIHADFRSGDEFFRLLCSFPALESLILDHIIHRDSLIPEPQSDTAKTTLPSINTIRFRNIMCGSKAIIDALLPFCSTIVLLDVHFLGHPLAALDSYLAISHLITTTGGSLQRLSIELRGSLHKSDLAKAFLHHWDVSRNTNLRELLLDIDTDVQPFLQRMASSVSCNGYAGVPSRLEVLDIPWLISCSQDLQSLDNLLQHPRFAYLVRLKSVVRIRHPSESRWLASLVRLNPTTEMRNKMDEDIGNCQKQLSGCYRRGILELKELYM